VDFAGNVAGFAEDRFPTVEYLRIFFQALRPEPANGPQIVDALERAVRLAHLQNLFRRRRPDARNLLQFPGRRGVDVYRFCWRLFLGERARTEQQAEIRGTRIAKVRQAMADE